MGGINNLPKPKEGHFAVARVSGRGWLVFNSSGAEVSGPWRTRDEALASCEAHQRATNLAAKRMTRPCMCCGQPFDSEGIHNRMCNACRHRDVAPDPFLQSTRRMAKA